MFIMGREVIKAHALITRRDRDDRGFPLEIRARKESETGYRQSRAEYGSRSQPLELFVQYGVKINRSIMVNNP